MRRKARAFSTRALSSPAPTRSGFDFVMERFGRIRDMDRSFDIEYWQRQGDAAIYRAAWELVELHHRDQGKDPNELRLQRSIGEFLNAAKVRYLVVGGFAVMKYTEPRDTKDLDLWIEATPRNARLVFKALKEFGAPLANLTEADFSKEGFFYQMGRPPTRVDIVMSIEGVRFADAWRDRVATDFDGVPGQVIGLKHLIANKQAVGRPQDLMDVTNLLESGPVAEKPPQQLKSSKKKRPKGRRPRYGSIEATRQFPDTFPWDQVASTFLVRKRNGRGIAWPLDLKVTRRRRRASPAGPIESGAEVTSNW